MGTLSKEQRELAEGHFAKRQEAFLADYTELVKKHGLEFQGYLMYTPGGIMPQWRIQEHTKETPKADTDPTPEDQEKADTVQEPSKDLPNQTE